MVKALREVAMHLMHRETPYQENDCSPLADAILARASAMAPSKVTSNKASLWVRAHSFSRQGDVRPWGLWHLLPARFDDFLRR